MRNRISSRRAGSRPTRYGFRPWNAAVALSPPPPISPRPTRPSSVSTSTIVRTKRPQWHPFACRSGASRGTLTGVARMSAMRMRARAEERLDYIRRDGQEDSLELALELESLGVGGVALQEPLDRLEPLA